MEDIVMCGTIRKPTMTKKAHEDTLVRRPSTRPEERSRINEVTVGGSWVRSLVASLLKGTRKQAKKEKELEEA